MWKGAKVSGRSMAIRDALVIALLLAPIPAGAQLATDFSGTWELVSAAAPGARGAGRGGNGSNSISSNTMSGAPFNCGRRCTIAQRGAMLVVDQAYLGSATTPAPAVTLHLDGRQEDVVDSFSPSRQIPATAQWVGEELEITSATSSQKSKLMQHLSIEGGQLVVVNAIDIPGVQAVTFKYKKLN